MKITIKGHIFEGPFESTSQLQNKSGVYVILGQNTKGEKYSVIDVGESGEIKTRIENHDRKDCWERQRYSTISIAVYYTNESNRMTIEKEIRNQSNPPCGER